MRQALLKGAATAGRLKGLVFRPFPLGFKKMLVATLGALSRRLPGKLGSLCYAFSYSALKHVFSATSQPLWATRAFDEGFVMRLDVTQKTQRILYLQKTYEPEVLHFFRSNIKRGDIVFDIGANTGFYTLLAATLAGKEGWVFAFEPEAKNYALLQENMRLNQLKNIAAFQAAVGEKSGHATFHINPLNDGGGSIEAMDTYADDGERWSKKKIKERFADVPLEVNVLMTTLDLFIKKEGVDTGKISLIKIDIEGGELRALLGARELLAKAEAPDIICEVSENHDALWHFLKESGYSIYTLNHDGSRGNEIKQTNSFRGKNFLLSKTHYAERIR